MRSLVNKENTISPDSDFPYGRVRDNNGTGNGTPLNEATHGDFHQFFEKLMAQAGITPNELPENAYTGFQLNEALDKIIRDSNRYDTIQFIIDGGGTTITTGFKGDIEVPFDCTVIGWRIYSRVSGSIVVDIYKDDYTSFPGTSSIAGSEKPTLSSATKNEDTSLGSFSTTLLRGDILGYNVDSISGVERVTVVLLVEKV